MQCSRRTDCDLQTERGADVCWAAIIEWRASRSAPVCDVLLLTDVTWEFSDDVSVSACSTIDFSVGTITNIHCVSEKSMHYRTTSGILKLKFTTDYKCHVWWNEIYLAIRFDRQCYCQVYNSRSKCPSFVPSFVLRHPSAASSMTLWFMPC